MKYIPILILAAILCCLSSCEKSTDPDHNKVSAPEFNPPSGIYNRGQDIRISCSSDFDHIYYTTDGSEPTENSSLYSEPVDLTATTTFKAKAFKAGRTPSLTATAVYTAAPQNFSYVEGGTFNNGVSNVAVSAFYLGQYEVTQSEYSSLMTWEYNGSYGTGANYPVYLVTWYNAIEYCNRRSIQEALTPCYSFKSFGTNPSNWPLQWPSEDSLHTGISCNWSANGYRLPSEMEWEFAARGGILSHNFTYSGSDFLEYIAWWGGASGTGNSGDAAHEVGSLAANELGIFDMTGNVWEWVWDIYDLYPANTCVNPHGAANGTLRLSRGGGWRSSPEYCAVSFRYPVNPAQTFGSFGFRICRSTQ